MHAFYCRLLHLHHDTHDEQHEDDDLAAQNESTPQAPTRAATEPTLRARPTRASTPRSGARGGLDRDRRPGLHTLVVPRLIDSGYSLDQISDLTGMPHALVELIADEHGAADPAILAAAAAARELRRAQLRTDALARRRRTRTVAVIVLAAVLNIVAGLASMLWRVPTLGAAATLGSFLLVGAVFLLARRGGGGGKPDRLGPSR